MTTPPENKSENPLFRRLCELGYYPALPIERFELLLRALIDEQTESLLKDAGEPEGWLFECGKPGLRTAFCSIDENDTTHWPVDQWTLGVKKTPLYTLSPSTAALQAELTQALTRLEAAEMDTLRLDYLQQQGATVSLAPRMQASEVALCFRVGGMYCSDNIDIRASIDAALATEQNK